MKKKVGICWIQVCSCLWWRPEGATSKEIIELTGYSDSAVRQALRRQRKVGRVKQLDGFKYVLTREARKDRFLERNAAREHNQKRYQRVDTCGGCGSALEFQEGLKDKKIQCALRDGPFECYLIVDAEVWGCRTCKRLYYRNVTVHEAYTVGAAGQARKRSDIGPEQNRGRRVGDPSETGYPIVDWGGAHITECRPDGWHWDVLDDGSERKRCLCTEWWGHCPLRGEDRRP
jgi:hypothetical protein